MRAAVAQHVEVVLAGHLNRHASRLCGRNSLAHSLLVPPLLACVGDAKPLSCTEIINNICVANCPAHPLLVQSLPARGSQTPRMSEPSKTVDELHSLLCLERCLFFKRPLLACRARTTYSATAYVGCLLHAQNALTYSALMPTIFSCSAKQCESRMLKFWLNLSSEQQFSRSLLTAAHLPGHTAHRLCGGRLRARPASHKKPTRGMIYNGTTPQLVSASSPSWTYSVWAVRRPLASAASTGATPYSASPAQAHHAA